MVTLKRSLLLLASGVGAYLAGVLMVKTLLIVLARKLSGSPYAFFAPAIGLWLMGISATLLSLFWSFVSNPRRFWPAAIWSALAIGFSCSGLTQIHIVSTTTVNGQVTSHIESKWFFLASLALGLLLLGNALWKARGSNAGPQGNQANYSQLRSGAEKN
jgi:hypothetical protein